MKPFNIKGQRITGLYCSSTANNWALLETNQATFELRPGGIAATTEKRTAEFAIDLPVLGKTIAAVKTDDFVLYFEFEDGTCLVHSDTGLNNDGSTYFEVCLFSKADFDADRIEWYDADPDLKTIE